LPFYAFRVILKDGYERDERDTIRIPASYPDILRIATVITAGRSAPRVAASCDPKKLITDRIPPPFRKSAVHVQVVESTALGVDIILYSWPGLVWV
jgi:hypothetical protein